MHGGRRAFQVGRIELMDQRAQQPGHGGSELGDELRPRGDAGRRRVFADDAGILHHALNLFVEFVAVGDDRDAGLRIMFQKPLGEQHHEDTLAAALSVPDDAALAFADAYLG